MCTVSWNTGSNCGNQSFETILAMTAFIEQNYRQWLSYSRWVRVAEGYGIYRLEPLVD